MKRINIVGVFPGRGIGQEAKKCILESQIIFSGLRNQELLGKISVPVFPIETLKEFSARLLKAYSENKIITIIASGDPFFYGIGKYVSEHYDRDEIYIIPEVSSLQVALSRIKMDANDIYTISLHGRDIKGLAQRIRGKPKIAIFTDCLNTPSRIGEYMINFGLDNYSAYLFENLGYDSENIGYYSMNQLRNVESGKLNLIILEENDHKKSMFPDDHLFSRRNNNITKKEIRELSVSELNLRMMDVFWDIGAGSGSISIYASFIDNEGKIYAIEKDRSLCSYIEENMKKFSCDINIVNKIAPEGLEGLPDPDAVFIGGSSGNLENIVDYSYRRLKPGGRMVINITTLENLRAVMEYIKASYITAEIRQVNISRLIDISKYTRFVPLDQIYIIKVTKNE
jgi:precorrin-6Y C5,15-methyltransferase (decarboxylating)